MKMVSNVKILICVAIILLLFVAFTACGSSEPTNPLVGRWEGVTWEEVWATGSYTHDMTGDFLELHYDGTGHMGDINLSWASVDGFLTLITTFAVDVGEYTISDNILTFSFVDGDNIDTYTFHRVR